MVNTINTYYGLLDQLIYLKGGFQSIIYDLFPLVDHISDPHPCRGTSSLPLQF